MHFDCIILGAGINGGGIAREGALQGKSVLIIDKGTVGCGTSSKSSRLIHGGLRYLEYFQFKLVKESLHDRNLLVEMYPDLVKMVPFHFPVYKGSYRAAWKVGIGLKMYDFLSNAKYKSSKISLDEFKNQFPAIETNNLKAVYKYYDARTNDLKLTQQVVKEAVEKNAVLLENTKVTEIEINNNITVKAEGKEYTTNNLINATGPWLDEVADKFNFPAHYYINKVSGIHIEIKDKIAPYPLFLQTETKRMFFIIPEKETTLIGTTEREETVPCDDVTVNEEDIDYLIKHANKYLAKKISKADIKNSFIGIRALIKSKGSLTASSRDYKFDLIRKGTNKILHVFGGKLTTYMTLAKNAFKKLGI